VTLSTDLDEFGQEHRPHGTMTVTAGETTEHGYRLEVACLRGVTFERRVFPDDAAEDLAYLARLN
jgi:hypothetical protein